MVEVRLDTAAELGLPGDCFLSLRIGDAQKLSRLSASRTYNFPKGADRRYGKIEVFQRIGSCGVDVDPDNKGSRQVSIGLGGASELRLNVAVETRAGAGPKTTTTTQSAEATAKNARAAGAKDYISKTGIEFYLAEAMQDVLRERPANALKFLAERLMQESEKQGHGTFLPALKGAKAPADDRSYAPKPPPHSSGARPPVGPGGVAGGVVSPSHRQPGSVGRQQKLEPLAPGSASSLKAAPLPGITPVSSKLVSFNKSAESTDVLPFKQYFARHMHSATKDLARLYMKFPAFQQAAQRAAAVAPFKRYCAEHMHSATKDLAALYSKFPASTRRTWPVAPPPFAQLPSVGSWLAYKPRPAPPAPPAAGRPFALLPSVGTWLAPKPQPEPQPEPQQAAPFAPPAVAWSPPVLAASEVVLGTNFLTSPVLLMWTSAQLGPGFLSMGPSPGLMFI
mmetsp:Transcript_26523/g.74507  ORF Transcript_26523/g.74507 Transcript_26523/m.74507 type:complete len:451 (-) Transcript_26523:54-1406(-)